MVGDRKTLSILQACQHVGVSRRTIYNWINSGKVEYVRTAGGSVRIFADSLWRKPEVSDTRVAEAADLTTQATA
jgi:excisionase family DNA binding protein